MDGLSCWFPFGTTKQGTLNGPSDYLPIEPAIENEKKPLLVAS